MKNYTKLIGRRSFAVFALLLLALAGSSAEAFAKTPHQPRPGSQTLAQVIADFPRPSDYDMIGGDGLWSLPGVQSAVKDWTWWTKQVNASNRAYAVPKLREKLEKDRKEWQAKVDDFRRQRGWAVSDEEKTAKYMVAFLKQAVGPWIRRLEASK